MQNLCFYIVKAAVLHGKSVGFASQKSRFRNAKLKLLFFYRIIFTEINIISIVVFSNRSYFNVPQNLLFSYSPLKQAVGIDVYDVKIQVVYTGFGYDFYCLYYSLREIICIFAILNLKKYEIQSRSIHIYGSLLCPHSIYLWYEE